MSNQQIQLKQIVDSLDVKKDAALIGHIINAACNADKKGIPVNPLEEQNKARLVSLEQEL